MQDRVADVLRQRASLERGLPAAVALSLLLHGGLTAAGIYAAMHATPPQPVTTIDIRLQASPRAAQPRASAPRTITPAAPKPAEAKKPEPPKLAQQPTIEPPVTATKPPEKNTVPLSPFGRSTQKGSENPAAKAPAPVAPPAATSTGPEIAVGGQGVTGLEGGDFPYTLYLEGMQRKIGTNWFRPQVAAGISVIIYFRIQRDGTITDSRVATPSSNPTFDRQALSAVRSSSPLNPLPFNYQGQYLGVTLTFR